MEKSAGIGRIVRDHANLFALVAVLLGTLYSIAIPYGAGFDEERHLVRIFDMARGYILPNRNPPSFKATVTRWEFFDLSYQRRFTQTPAFDLFAPEAFWSKLGNQPSDRRYGYVTGSIYSPVIFMPQAIIANIFWRQRDVALLPVIILMRLAGLAIYVAAGWLTIRLLPTGKWVMAALALAPTAIYQATTLNADGFNNAASFLFIAASLHAYVRQPDNLKPRHVWMLAGCALLLGIAKPGAVVLLLLWLIFLTKKFPYRKWAAALVAAAVLAIFLNAGWVAVASRNSSVNSDKLAQITQQVSLEISKPADLLSHVIGTLGSFGNYAKDWIAVYGYRAREVPPPVFALYFLVLAIALSTQSPGERSIGRRARISLVSLFLLFSAMWMAFYMFHVTGWQPRYFVAFAPLLFLAISGLVHLKETLKPVVSVAGTLCFVAATGFYSFGIYTTYYTYCDYPAYVGGRCALPIYKNLEKSELPEVNLASVGMVSQTFTSECNGLEEVSVFVKSNPPGGEATVVFSLFDASDHLIAETEFTQNEIPDFDYLALPFSPPTGKAHSIFRIQLEALNSSPGYPIGLGLIDLTPYPHAGPFNEDGDLIAGGETLTGDLLFHYVCERP